jgi:hypothetical protein
MLSLPYYIPVALCAPPPITDVGREKRSGEHRSKHHRRGVEVAAFTVR